jgi:hypothetical protein
MEKSAPLAVGSIMPVVPFPPDKCGELFIEASSFFVSNVVYQHPV